MEENKIKIRTRPPVSPSPILEEETESAWDAYGRPDDSQEIREKTEEISDLMQEAEEASPDQFDMWNHPKLQGFLSFVEQKIKEMQEYAKLSKELDILTFNEVNDKLANHYEVYLSMLSLYNVAIIEQKREEAMYQEWFDEKYLLIRKRENTASLSANKWLSKNEIDSMVRIENKEEYRKKYASLIASQRQSAFLLRLRDSWESQKYSLQTISKNMQTEYRNSHLSDSSEWG